MMYVRAKAIFGTTARYVPVPVAIPLFYFIGHMGGAALAQPLGPPPGFIEPEKPVRGPGVEAKGNSKQPNLSHIPVPDTPKNFIELDTMGYASIPLLFY